MRKFMSVMLALLILAGAVSVNAFAADDVSPETIESQETTYLSFGEIDGLELVYLPSDHSEETYTYIIGNWCFTADSSFSNFGIMCDEVFTPLGDAYGKTVNDSMLSAFVGLFENGKAATELEAWEAVDLNVPPDESGTSLDDVVTETDPIESQTESATVSETDPSEPDNTETWEETYPPTDPVDTQPSPWETYTETESNIHSEPFENETVHPTGIIIHPTEPHFTEPVENPTGIHIQTDPAETELPTDSHKTTENDSKNTSVNKLNIKTATVKCGRVIKLSVTNKGNKKVTFISANPSVAKVGKTSGRVCALKKGSTYITAKIGSKKLRFTINVISNPKLSENSVKVKKGKTVKVKIVGKCPLIKNKYGTSKYAEIVSKTTADTLKVKGLKKGKTTLKIKVNGYLLKLKVRIS